MSNRGRVEFVKIRYLLWYGPVVILGLSLLGPGADGARYFGDELIAFRCNLQDHEDTD